MNRDLNIKSTIRQILGVLISIMILMPFTVSSQTVTTTIDCANATTDINGNGYRWDLSNKILALDGIDLRTSQMMGIELPPNSTITLQGDNYIEGASRAILFNIGSTEQDPGGTLTIKGDGTLTLNSTNTPSAIFNAGTSTIKHDQEQSHTCDRKLDRHHKRPVGRRQCQRRKRRVGKNG